MKVKKRIKNWEHPINDIGILSALKHGLLTQYGWVVYYPKLFTLHKYTDIGYGTFINAKYGVEIEEEVEIGPYCTILSDNSINNERGKIKICKNVKIGAYTLILPNITIPENQIIKARSNIVNKDNVTICYTDKTINQFKKLV